MNAFIEAATAIFANMGTLTSICLIVGIALVILEIFVPGFGVPGITGGILIIASIFFTANTILEVLLMLIFVLIILGIALAIVIRLAKKGKLSRGIVLDTTMNSKEDQSIGNKDLEYFIGKTGVTLSKLRPAGSIDLDGVKLDAVTEGYFIDSNKKIVVTKVDGIRIVVKEVK